LEVKPLSVLVHVVLILICVALMLPILYMILTAFKPKMLAVLIPPVWIFSPTLDNFERLFTGTEFLNGFKNSIIIAAVSVPIATIISAMAGYALDRWDFWGKETVALLFLAVWMFPAIALVIPLFMIHQALGLLNTHIGIILVYIYGEAGLAIWLMRTYFSAIPREIDEAARLDGHSAFGAFFKVILPLNRSGVASTALILLMLIWNDFLVAYILTRSAVRPLIPVIAGFIGFHGVDIGLMTAAGFLSSLPVLVIALLIQKELVKGFTFGAIR